MLVLRYIELIPSATLNDSHRAHAMSRSTPNFPGTTLAGLSTNPYQSPLGARPGGGPRVARNSAAPPQKPYAWMAFITHPLAAYTFYILCVLSACNGFALLARLNRFYISTDGQRELPLFPVFTLFTILMVLAFTRERAHGKYFWFAWSFYVVYILFGFAGPYQITGTSFYTVAELIVKNWISLIAFPWLAFRVVSPDKLPKFLFTILFCFSLGGILSVFQSLNSGFFGRFIVEEGRGGGFWMNPNTCGLILLMGLFLSFLHNWKSPLWINLIRASLVAGVLLTYSRTAIISASAGGMVYALAYGRATRIVQVMLVIAILGFGLVLFGMMVESGTIPIENESLRVRISKISEMVSGKFSSDDKYNTRTPVWEAAIKQVIYRGGLVFGTGHGSMERAVEHNGSFLAPHNEYIYIWGNSGIPGLLAYLIFLGVFFVEARKCRDPRIRAGIMGTMAVFMSNGIFGHSMFSIHSMGPILAILAMYMYYGQLPAQPPQQPGYRLPGGLPPPRPAGV